MISEAFDRKLLLNRIDLADPGFSNVIDEIDLCSDDEEENEYKDPGVESIRRFNLQGTAAKVTPITNLNPYIHQSLIANLPFTDDVPLLVQYLTPLCLGDYDTLLLAPPSQSHIEAILIPIINQMMMSVDHARVMNRRPGAVIICSRKEMRRQIAWVAANLTRDLQFVTVSANSKDKLNEYIDSSEDQKIDILITAPAAYIAFTKRGKSKDKRPTMPDLFLERLQYFVVFEMEEIFDSVKDYSKIITNLRKEKDCTLIMQTHTSFVNRGHAKKNFDFDYTEKRENMENMLRDDGGIIIIDPSIAVKSFVVMDDIEIHKLQFLHRILTTHKGRYGRTGHNEQFFVKRVLIAVANEDRARFLIQYLTSSGRYHDPVVGHQQILHMEREMDRSNGRRPDPFRRIKKGNVMVVVTSDVHTLRLTQSVIDKVFFFDLIPYMDTLVMNCSRAVMNRYNFFFLNQRDLIEKKQNVRSLVQYLKDTGTVIPPELEDFESIPHFEKSLY